ncbi:MAG: hypothetical protein ACT4QF_11245 [Sporichthyaceae bacterium]
MFFVEVLELVVGEPTVLEEWPGLPVPPVVTEEGDLWSVDEGGNLVLLLAEQGEWWAARTTEVATGATTMLPSARQAAVQTR